MSLPFTLTVDKVQSLNSVLSREDLIQSATHCYDAQEVGYELSFNPVHRTVLIAKLEDYSYTTAPRLSQNEDLSEKLSTKIGATDRRQGFKFVRFDSLEVDAILFFSFTSVQSNFQSIL